MAQQTASKEILDRIYSKDDFDYTSIKHLDTVKVCVLCNKEFYPFGRNASRQRYCNRTHFIDCLVCGEPIEQKEPSDKIGTIKCTCSRKCADKLKMQNMRRTMIDRYGHENPSQVPELKEKISAGLKAKSKETTAKVIATMQERYGGMGTASPILRTKIEATMQERYGVTNPSDNDEIRKKISEICKSPEYQQKYAATALANWGTERPSKVKEVKEKMKATNLERYGVECTLRTDYAKQRFEEVCIDKYGVPNVLLSDYAHEKSREAMIANRHNHNNKISKLNQTIAEEFKKRYNLDLEFEFMINRKSFDFIVKGTNILLEINPSYTHSDLPNHWTDIGLPPEYHLERTKLAEENRYRCIHVFDWDNLEKIGQILQPKSTIYARKCDLKHIDNSTASEFLNKYHIQGSTRGAKYLYGLYRNDELVSVMTFGEPRYNKNYEWELLRLCTRSDLKVVGGASKMFKKFIEEADPQSIISYCDRAKFTGGVYNKLGFKLHHISPPAKVWSRGNKYITDNLLRQRGYDQLFDTDYGSGTSNEELMIKSGWRSVYDCGQLIFEWLN